MGANDTIVATRPAVPGPGRQEHEEAPLEFQVVKLSDVGRVRTHNEDYVDHHVPEDPLQRDQRGVLCLVADGMGGHQAGEVASREAVQFVIGQYYGDATHDVGTSLVRAFKAANRLVHEQAQADTAKAGMGTTLVGAVVLGQQVFVANVGDSRAYIIGKSGTNQITEDHSWVEEQVRAGLITQEQARVHPQRNLVTRALGSKASVEVDLFQGKIEHGDTLLLCTDGLTNHVRDPEIEVIVQQNQLEEAARLLVELAKERGGTDNITVLLVRASKAAEPANTVAARPVARRIPVLPVLAGATVVLAIAAVVVYLLLVKPEAQTTPVPSATIPLLVNSATPVDVSTTVPVPTFTLAASPEGSTPVRPEGTAPASGEAGTPSAPTSTLAPTITPVQPTPSPTETAPADRQTVGATATPAPPTLTGPAANATLQGVTAFSWTYAAGLVQNQAFQVLIWPEGEPTPHNGAAGFWKEPGPTRFEQTVDLDAISATVNGPGTYRWTVVVVNTQTNERLTAETAGRAFTYAGRPVDQCAGFDCNTFCKANLCLARRRCEQCCGGCVY